MESGSWDGFSESATDSILLTVAIETGAAGQEEGGEISIYQEVHEFTPLQKFVAMGKN
jgi:hypothetical protein